jgi:hypothetical protein
MIVAKTAFTRAMLNDLVAQNDRALNDKKHISLNKKQFSAIVSALNLRIDTLKNEISSVWDSYVEYEINQSERDQLIAIYQQQIDQLMLIINTINA